MAPSPPPPPQPLRGSGCACLPRASGQCARPQPQPWGGRATCPPSPGRRRCGPAASAAGAAGCAAAAGDTGSTGRCTARGRHAGRPGGRLAAAPRPVSGSCSAGSVRRQGRVREDCPASGGHRACPHDPSPGGVRPRRRRAGPARGQTSVGTTHGLRDLLREALAAVGGCSGRASAHRPPVSWPRVLGGLGPVSCVAQSPPAPACDTRPPQTGPGPSLTPHAFTGVSAPLTPCLGPSHAKLGSPTPGPPGCEDAAAKPQEPTPGVPAGGHRGATPGAA